MNDCDCSPGPVAFKILLTTSEGDVIDDAVVCRECLMEYVSLLVGLGFSERVIKEATAK